MSGEPKLVLPKDPRKRMFGRPSQEEIMDYFDKKKAAEQEYYRAMDAWKSPPANRTTAPAPAPAQKTQSQYVAEGLAGTSYRAGRHRRSKKSKRRARKTRRRHK